MKTPPPKCLAMIICQGVWTHPVRKTISIMEVFGEVASGKFPIIMPSLTIFMQFIDGRGVVPLVLRFTREEDAEVIWSAEERIDFGDDPLHIQERHVTIEGLRFERAGMYSIGVYHDEELIAVRTFLAKKR